MTPAGSVLRTRWFWRLVWGVGCYVACFVVPPHGPAGAVMVVTFTVCTLGVWKWRRPAQLPPG
jgi:Flp pilus assembly protein TadB